MITAQQCKQMAAEAIKASDFIAFQEACAGIENGIRHAASQGKFHYSINTQYMSSGLVALVIAWLRQYGFLVNDGGNPLNLTWLVQ